MNILTKSPLGTTTLFKQSRNIIDKPVEIYRFAGSAIEFRDTRGYQCRLNLPSYISKSGYQNERYGEFIVEEFYEYPKQKIQWHI